MDAHQPRAQKRLAAEPRSLPAGVPAPEAGGELTVSVLPLHGPRKAGLLSGERLLSGDTMELVHTGVQAAWNIRRLLAWLRLPDQDAPAVGVLGHSLGG